MLLRIKKVIPPVIAYLSLMIVQYWNRASFLDNTPTLGHRKVDGMSWNFPVGPMTETRNLCKRSVSLDGP